jgi:hypothetical protein
MPERAENEDKERLCGIASSFFFGHSKRPLRQSSIPPTTASASPTLAAIVSTVHRPRAGPPARQSAWKRRGGPAMNKKGPCLELHHRTRPGLCKQGGSARMSVNQGSISPCRTRLRKYGLRQQETQENSCLPCLEGCDRSNSVWSGMELVIALNRASWCSHLLARIAGEQGAPIINVSRWLVCNRQHITKPAPMP